MLGMYTLVDDGKWEWYWILYTPTNTTNNINIRICYTINQANVNEEESLASQDVVFVLNGYIRVYIETFLNKEDVNKIRHFKLFLLPGIKWNILTETSIFYVKDGQMFCFYTRVPIELAEKKK